MTMPDWEDILFRIILVDVYTDIRDDLIRIFIAAYHDSPVVQNSVSSFSLPELKERADKQADAARHYDPAKPVKEAQALVGGVYKIIETFLIALIIIGSIFSITFVVAFSRSSLSILDSATGVVVSLAIMASSGLTIALLGLVLFIRILYFSTFVVRSLNRKLIIGRDETTTRDQPLLVGYLVWNSSLNGGKALHLLTIFSIFKILSAIPYWDPYRTIRTTVEENIDVIVNAEGRWEAFQLLREQMRKNEAEEQEEESEATEKENQRVRK